MVIVVLRTGHGKSGIRARKGEPETASSKFTKFNHTSARHTVITEGRYCKF
jgi:hypothetical protein